MANLKLPPGWVYIPMEAADSFPGAFHDEVSGLVVRSEVVPLRGVVHPWAETALRQGGAQEQENIGGIACAVVRRPGAICETVTITADLRPDIGTTWNLETVSCDQNGLDRVKELVRAVVTPEFVSVVAPGSAATGVIRAAEVTRLKAGMQWDEVRQFGVPLGVEAAPQGGLVLTYIDGRPGHQGGSVRLALSRARSLVRWDLGH
jgi:hypothetical protein